MVTSPLVFNPFDAEWRQDPYPFYRELRSHAPIGQVPGIGIWYLTRYADCDAMLRNRKASSDTRNSELYRQLSESGVLRLPENVPAQRSFLFMDPPGHTRLRGLVSSAFTPNVVNNLRPRIQQLVDELLAAATTRRHFDVVDDLAYPLTFTVISDMIGIPRDAQPRFRNWSKAMSRSLDPMMTPPPDVVARQKTAQLEAKEFLEALISERRRNPLRDLISALIQVEQSGDKLSTDELLGTIILLAGAGHETTVNLIANGVLALLQHPDQLAILHQKPDLARAAADETLRWDPPIQMTQRIPLEDMEFCGVTIPRGSPVILLIGAANRDEAVVANGEEFNICRADFHHLAFGLGPHYCLGAMLGHLEGSIALAAVTSRFPEMRLSAEGVRRRSDLVMRGLESLPVEI